MNQKPSIFEIVGEYVQLRRAGKEYVGLCPFHADKTPSFTVNEDKGVFHCFGCSASGDVIKFIMMIDRVSFHEACAQLGIDSTRPRRHRRDPVLERARTITDWSNEQTRKVLSLLRDIGQRARLAKQRRLQVEVQHLARQWIILSDLADDLQDAKSAIEIYDARDLIEDCLLKDSEYRSSEYLKELTEYLNHA